MNTDMKFTALSILLSVCVYCSADDTNIIVKSDWSQPVQLRNLESGHDHYIRGRLLIISGTEPAYGGPGTTNAAMTFVELQNVTGAYSESPDLLFDSAKFKCALTYENGKEVQKSGGIVAYSGRGALVNWVTLPYNSTIRLFVNRESKSPLSIHSSGEPWSPRWSISSGDTNTYYLSGTIELCTRTNALADRFSGPFQSMAQPYYDENCKKALTIPKVKLAAPK